MKAHDVRNLCVCPGCGDLADKRDLLRVGKDHWHVMCAHKIVGTKAVKKLMKAAQ